MEALEPLLEHAARWSVEEWEWALKWAHHNTSHSGGNIRVSFELPAGPGGIILGHQEAAEQVFVVIEPSFSDLLRSFLFWVFYDSSFVQNRCNLRVMWEVYFWGLRTYTLKMYRQALYQQVACYGKIKHCPVVSYKYNMTHRPAPPPTLR